MDKVVGDLQFLCCNNQFHWIGDRIGNVDCDVKHDNLTGTTLENRKFSQQTSVP